MQFKKSIVNLFLFTSTASSQYLRTENGGFESNFQQQAMQQPGFVPPLPDIIQQQPGVIQQQPEVIQQPPEVMQQPQEGVPEVQQITPQSQEVMQQPPEIMQQPQQMIQQQPEANPQQPVEHTPPNVQVNEMSTPILDTEIQNMSSEIQPNEVVNNNPEIAENTPVLPSENAAISEVTQEEQLSPSTENAVPEPPANSEVAPITQGQSPASTSDLPKMHTFFTPFSPDSDVELLEVWKSTWREAGWEPVVLTLDDSHRNPDFDKLKAAFHEAPFQLKDYDRMCFFKWLAMANQGGWYSDYDTLPLNSAAESDGKELPNNGEFTTYSRYFGNIVSGSAEEWRRMSKLVFQNYELHSSSFWSDILAMQEIHDKMDGYHSEHGSITLARVYKHELKENNGVIERPMALSSKCQLLKDRRAIRFSHSDCFTIGFCDNNRGLALKWINEWKEKCADDLEPALRKHLNSA